MKKLLVIVLSLLSVSAWAQSGLLGKITDRFSDPEKGHTVFIEKGYRSVGISGGFRSFQVGGDSASDAYTVLSILQVGAGKLNAYNVSPRFSYFVADDVSLGVRLDYSGYNLDSDPNRSPKTLGIQAWFLLAGYIIKSPIILKVV